MQQVDFSAQKEQMCAECRYNTKTQVPDSTSGHRYVFKENNIKILRITYFVTGNTFE